MPSATCPQCNFVVSFVEDLIGILQCPGCGEELLRGRDAPRWNEEAPTPHYRDADVDHVPSPPARALEDDTEE